MQKMTLTVRRNAFDAMKVILNCSSDEQLAKALGCGRQSLHRYREGLCAPSPEFIATVMYETALPFENVFQQVPKLDLR